MRETSKETELGENGQAGGKRHAARGRFQPPQPFLEAEVSVSKGSGLSFRVWVQVQTEPLPNWRSRSSINPNCPLGYSFMENSQPV